MSIAALLIYAAAAAKFKGAATDASCLDMSCIMRVGDNEDACLIPLCSSKATPSRVFRLES